MTTMIELAMLAVAAATLVVTADNRRILRRQERYMRRADERAEQR